MTNILTGSLKDFSGTLSTNETSANNSRQVWNFGNGGESVTGAGNTVFGDGAILAGNTGSTDASLAAQYNVNYNNAELVLNALVQGNSNLTHAGTAPSSWIRPIPLRVPSASRMPAPWSSLARRTRPASGPVPC